MRMPSSLPEAHGHFLQGLIQRLPSDPRIVGVAAGGSFLTNTMDGYSDLDIVVAVEPAAYGTVMAERRRIASSLGRLLTAFTGEHVGEPTILICLYDDPLLHVDLNFISIEDVPTRVDGAAVLWERERRLSSALDRIAPHYHAPDPAWVEDRFWTWVHYAATKVGRGELFEALEALSLLRRAVLGPLAARRAGARPMGVRRMETLDADCAHQMRGTVAAYNAADCLRALRACVDLYRSVRPVDGPGQPEGAAERAVIEYLARLDAKYGGAAGRG